MNFPVLSSCAWWVPSRALQSPLREEEAQDLSKGPVVCDPGSKQGTIFTHWRSEVAHPGLGVADGLAKGER